MSQSLLIQSLGITDGYAGWQTLKNKPIASFKQFTNDPILKANIAYFQANIGKATTVDKFLADPRLQQVALTAFGLSAQIGANGLMKKVLNSDLTDTSSLANRLTTPGYKQLAAALGYGSASTPAIPPVASSADVAVDGFDGGANTFGAFSGTFGGVTVKDVDLSDAHDPAAVAAALTKAFQAADGGKTSITVSNVGFSLSFKDTAGRGTASGLAWTANPDSPGAPTAGDAANLRAGFAGLTATGGPKVGKSDTVSTIVGKYQQAMFDQVVGNSSSILSNALYAQQNLPGVTNWYSVMANTKLATVVETALNLPTSFQKLDVDQQNAILSRKMNVKDLQDPTKLGKLLDRYVAIAGALSGSSGVSSNPAVQLLTGDFSSSLSAGGTMSSGSIAALLLST